MATTLDPASTARELVAAYHSDLRAAGDDAALDRLHEALARTLSEAGMSEEMAPNEAMQLVGRYENCEISLPTLEREITETLQRALKPTGE